MTKRIFLSIFSTALICVVVMGAFIMLTLYNYFDARLTTELKTEASHIAHALSREEDNVDYFTGFQSTSRITLIAPDGTVLFDNTKTAADMETHSDRPEIISAQQSGSGESRRFSTTHMTETIYYAVLLDDGGVLRVSNTQSSVLGLLSSMITLFLFVLCAVAILSMVIARQLSRRIVAPINKLNLDAPLDNDTYDELSPLLVRMEHQNKALRAQIRVLNEKQQEMSAIADNMQEGLVLLDAAAYILSINTSASRVFKTDTASSKGNHILALNRSTALQNVINGAQQGENTEDFLTLHGRHYQLMASPVMRKSQLHGIVLFILNITDRYDAERSRREFTANVSHELKTPLTSILGYAEIMKDGVAKPQDMQGFAGRIHDEAGRLIALVEDILRLSQLDEKAKLPETQRVDLRTLADDVCERLQPLAEKHGISLTASGEPVIVRGVPKLLDEMLSNLCDNAIKYNRPDGSVTIEVADMDGKAVITVKDTGIGIPPEHQSHVFERFYRVDKSHSKETGGTGLGLSIVKHGAVIHHAQIELSSTVGEGTIVKLIFPL